MITSVSCGYEEAGGFFFLNGEISTCLLSLNESSNTEGNTKKEEKKNLPRIISVLSRVCALIDKRIHIAM